MVRPAHALKACRKLGVGVHCVIASVGSAEEGLHSELSGRLAGFGG